MCESRNNWEPIADDYPNACKRRTTIRGKKIIKSLRKDKCIPQNGSDNATNVAEGSATHELAHTSFSKLRRIGSFFCWTLGRRIFFAGIPKKSNIQDNNYLVSFTTGNLCKMPELVLRT